MTLTPAELRERIEETEEMLRDARSARGNDKAGPGEIADLQEELAALRSQLPAAK